MGERTPLRIGDSGMDVYEGTALFATTQPPVSGDCDLAAARAERIVRAVNNHDDLVKALQEILEPIEPDCDEPDCPDCGPWRNARAALARATKE